MIDCPAGPIADTVGRSLCRTRVERKVGRTECHMSATACPHLKEPLPGAGIDGLPHSPQNPQTAAVVLGHPGGALPLQGPYEGGGGVELTDLPSASG